MASSSTAWKSNRGDGGAAVSGSRTRFSDLALGLVADVFGLEDLHFGWFEPGEAVTMQTLPAAQRRYTQKLLAELPADAHRVLDVGCGTGVMMAQLLAAGRDVEGLSPDAELLAKARARVGAAAILHEQRFEDFTATAPFDAVLMAESVQYVKTTRGLAAAARAVRIGGVVVMADVFRIKALDQPFLSRGGHRYQRFLAAAGDAGFAVELDVDITDSVAPTLVLYHELLTTKIIPVADAFWRAGSRWRPFVSRILRFFFGARFSMIRERYRHQDPATFRAYRQYRMLRLRRVR